MAISHRLGTACSSSPIVSASTSIEPLRIAGIIYLAFALFGLMPSLLSSLRNAGKCVFTTLFICAFPSVNALAQYQTTASPFAVSLPTPTVNNFTFTSTKQNQSYTCSNGGGSAPALFAGVFSGVDKNTTNNLTEEVGSANLTRATTSFPGGAAAGAGFIIPFNPPGMSGQNCRKIIGLLEAQEMINTLSLLKQAGAISNDEYMKRLKAIDTSLWTGTSIVSASPSSSSQNQ
jgi:hypothetical protein